MTLRQPVLSRIRSAPRPTTHRAQALPVRRPCRRPNSTIPPSQTPQSPIPPPQPDRVSKILSRLPPRLQKYTSRLRGAPVTHVTAFLVLHELTAIVPLFVLFGAFHYYVDVSPVESWMRANYGTYVSQGMERFERYFRRKGWFGFSPEDDREAIRREVEDGELERDKERDEAAARRYKVVVEVALAYAVTKALLPVRIIGSVWATPWFAGVLGRLRRVVRR